jgi:endo-1,4-beta-D-glucanase Y
MKPMSILRAAFCLGLMASSAPAAPAVPFGSRPVPYTAGTLKPSTSNAVMDQVIRNYFAKWKAAYLVSVGHSGWKAVRSPDASHPFVAEAQGYGLEILALLAGADASAQSDFDAVLKYVLAHPSRINGHLMAAEQNAEGVSVNGGDSATDGDLSIAYALLLADKQWSGNGKYRRLALARIAAIRQSEMNPVTKLPLLGDWVSPSDSFYFGTRPSDFMLDHFRAFREATGDVFWDGVATACQNLISYLQAHYSPSTGLVPDFVVATNTASPHPAPANYLESRNDGAYSWNATRVPWRLGADAALFGNSTSRSQARAMSDWLRVNANGQPAKIRTGYTLAGKSLGSGGEPAFFSTIGPAAALGTDQAWLDALWTAMATEAAKDKIADYYGASLLLQGMIVVSGNYWSPVTTP